MYKWWCSVFLSIYIYIYIGDQKGILLWDTLQHQLGMILDMKNLWAGSMFGKSLGLEMNGTSQNEILSFGVEHDPSGDIQP